MKIYTEQSLRNFEGWNGAIDTLENLTEEQLDIIEEMLEDTYPEGMSETEINDLFWFETDYIAELLGYLDWEDLIKNK